VAFLEQHIHIFQRPFTGLWVEQVDDRYTRDVDRHEEEVHLGANVRNANGPDLSDNDGTYGAARSCEVEASSTEICGKDLSN
jgi:hypothetical protein